MEGGTKGDREQTREVMEAEDARSQGSLTRAQENTDRGQPSYDSGASRIFLLLGGSRYESCQEVDSR